MLETRGGLDLYDEAVGAEDGGELGLQHLERDPAVVLEVLGEVNGGHAAGAELALDAVAALEGRVQTIGDCPQEMGPGCREPSGSDTSRRN